MRLLTGRVRESRSVFTFELLLAPPFMLLLLLAIPAATPPPTPTPTPTPPPPPLPLALFMLILMLTLPLPLLPLPVALISCICICEMELSGGRNGVGDTSASIMLGGRTPLTLPPIEKLSRMTFIEVHLRTTKWTQRYVAL